MKKSKFQLSLLILTLACLFALVGIQINWILKAAQMQEAQFNHSVNMAMNRIVENLARDQAMCKEVNNCMRKGNAGSCYLMMKNREEWANMGSMIKNDLKYYGINLDFEFDIVDNKLGLGKQPNKSEYFSDDLENALQQSGFELRIKFPEKRDFIIAQIGYIFIFSIALLALVTLSFIMIFGFYKKEKKLTENIVDFINNMTHEFKTPLTNIALANSMISKTDTVESDEKLTFYSRVIKTEHGKLKQRVEELLKTSFSETGKPLFNECIDVSLVIENVIETYSVQIKEKAGSFIFNKEGENFNVNGNIDLFHIAMGNIVDNAIKYCTTTPEINILLTSKNNILIVEISDNGIGITKDQQTQIFDKYYRVPTGDIHDNNGFGLGLYHVKNIVTKMGGKINVTSSKGKGSTFSLEFPFSGNK
ncbi:MAG: HAMP domain-containing sensor histidine kinase [Bacteroidia bacterium]|nr:HAMP domain-containing sensor histidine kinase [Bacteroidia bacterium]